MGAILRCECGLRDAASAARVSRSVSAAARCREADSLSSRARRSACAASRPVHAPLLLAPARGTRELRGAARRTRAADAGVAVRRRHTPAHVQRMLHTPACTSWCGALCSGACARAPRQRARAAPTLLLPHMSATLSSAREAKAAPSCRQSEQKSKHSHNGHAPICSGSRQTRAQRSECIHFLRTVRAAPRLAHAPAQKHAHAQTAAQHCGAEARARCPRSVQSMPVRAARCAESFRSALRGRARLTRVTPVSVAREWVARAASCDLSRFSPPSLRCQTPCCASQFLKCLQTLPALVLNFQSEVPKSRVEST